jgi:predicted permease
MIASGISLARRGAFGFAVGPPMLVFNVLMPIAIIAMFVAMRIEGVPTDLTPVAVLATLALASAFLVARFLRGRRHSGVAVHRSANADASMR